MRSRDEIVKPLLLLTDSRSFNEAKAKKTKEYNFLCDIIAKMRVLYLSGESIYHHFAMLLQELQVLGFAVDSMEAVNCTDEHHLKDEIDLLLQFLAFRYPFDEYDNKIGVHDPETNQFLFSQP